MMEVQKVVLFEEPVGQFQRSRPCMDEQGVLEMRFYPQGVTLKDGQQDDSVDQRKEVEYGLLSRERR